MHDLSAPPPHMPHMASALHSPLHDAKPSAASVNDDHWRRAQQILAELEELDEEPLEPYPTIQISGIVTAAPDSSLVEGAQVVLRSANGHPLSVPSTTAADGSFLLSCVPDVMLEDAREATTLKLTVKHAEHAPATALLYVNDTAQGASQWVEIRMLRAGAVEVLAVTPDPLISSFPHLLISSPRFSQLLPVAM